MEETVLEIELTPEQREQLKKASGKDVPAVKLNLVELEARFSPRIALN
jgi:hypothetical protein